MTLPPGTRTLFDAESDQARTAYARLARLARSGGLRASSAVTVSGTGQAELPIGWELRYEQATKRLFFIDHSTRSTTMIDPRTVEPSPSQHGASVRQSNSSDLSGSGGEAMDPMAELSLLLSAALPDSAGGPGEYRAALNRVLRPLLLQVRCAALHPSARRAPLSRPARLDK